MTKKVIDEVVLKIVPEVSNNDKKKIDKTLENSSKKLEKELSKHTAMGLSAGFKNGVSTGKNFISRNKGKIFGGVAAGLTAAIGLSVKTANDALGNIQQQLDVADQLGTRAAQSGIELREFLKLQKLLEFGDVDANVASQAIIQFQRRLGGFKQFGMDKEAFGRLGITSQDSEQQAFLKAISALQNLSGSEKNIFANKLFGGIGLDQLGEFLSGNLSKQLKEIENIDFTKLASQVELGGAEQEKITKANAEAATKKLLETDLKADAIVSRIKSETERTIANSQEERVKELIKSANNVSETINKLSLLITKLIDVSIKAIDKIGGFFGYDDDFDPTEKKNNISD